MKDLNNIDSYFNALKEAPTPPGLDEAQWSNIEAGLKRKEFYTFSLFRFNIFYAIALMLNFLGTVYIVFDHVNSKQQNMVVQKPLSNDSVYTDNPRKDVLVKEKIETIQSKESEIAADKPSISPVQKKQEVLYRPDSIVPAVPTSVPNTTQAESQEKEKQKDTLSEHRSRKEVNEPVEIYKRDTIIRYDSIKVSPKKLRRLKQK